MERNRNGIHILGILMTVILLIPLKSAFAEETPESLLNALRDRDAKLNQAFTLGGIYESPANSNDFDQGIAVRRIRMTGNETTRGLSLTEPIYSMPPQYKPPETGQYRPTEYDQERNLIFWKKHNHYALHTPLVSVNESAFLGFAVHPDGSFTQHGPTGSQFQYRPDDPFENSLYEFNRILYATGRGYARYLTAITRIEKGRDGLLQVTANGRYSSWQGVIWELTVDLRADYLVRSVRVTTKNKEVLLECTTSGTLSSEKGFLIAERGNVSIPLSASHALRYSITFGSFRQQVDQELLNSLQARFSGPRPEGPPHLILDHRNDPKNPVIREGNKP